MKNPISAARELVSRAFGGDESSAPINVPGGGDPMANAAVGAGGDVAATPINIPSPGEDISATPINVPGGGDPMANAAVGGGGDVAATPINIPSPLRTSRRRRSTYPVAAIP